MNNAARISISVPPDVAQRLRQEPRGDVSAYITDAVRARMRTEQIINFMNHHGLTPPTPERRAEIRAQLAAGRANVERARNAMREHIAAQRAQQDAAA